MLTQNFYNIMISLMKQVDESSNTKIPYTNHRGEQGTLGYSRVNFQGLYKVLSEGFNKASVYGIRFGTGTTPPAMTDYNLEAPILDGSLSSEAVAPMQGFDTDHARIYVTHEVKNNSQNAVTITEAGVFGSPTTNNSLYYLLDRTVFDTPVTIPAGGTKSITYAIVFDYPTA